MRLILLYFFFATTLIYAKSFGVVIIEGKHFSINQRLTGEMQELFKEQMHYYSTPKQENLHVIIDRDKSFKKLYTHSGTQALIAYAQKKSYDSLAIIEYKKGSKFLSFMVVVNDPKVQEKKSQLIAYKAQNEDILAKTLLNGVLSLNYQLGVFNVPTRY